MAAVLDRPNQLERWGHTRPRVLVAEDLRGLLNITTRQLKKRGLDVVPVTSLAQARKVAKVYSFDVALLDINLEYDAADDSSDAIGGRLDTSGLVIARELRESQPNARIIGYSGRFRDGLPTEDLDVFTETFAKGSLDQEDHRRLWDLCRDLGAESLRSTLVYLAAHFYEVRREYEDANPVDDFLAEAIHETGSFPDLDDSDLRYAAEGELAVAQYEIRRVRLRSSNGSWTRPLLVWQYEGRAPDGSALIDLEVYGFPQLYSGGRSEKEAVANLGSFVNLVAADVERGGATSPGDSALCELMDYLGQS